jgi:hypothetical protein
MAAVRNLVPSSRIETERLGGRIARSAALADDRVREGRQAPVSGELAGTVVAVVNGQIVDRPDDARGCSGSARRAQGARIPSPSRPG